MKFDFKLLFIGLALSLLLSIVLNQFGYNVFFGALILPFFFRSK